MESLLIGCSAKPILQSFSFPTTAAATTTTTNLSSIFSKGPIPSSRVSNCIRWNVGRKNYVGRIQSSFGNNRADWERSLFYKRSDKSDIANATSERSFGSEPESYNKSIQTAVDVFYRFSRPHTVIGTVKFKLLFAIERHYNWLTKNYIFKQALSIVSVSLLAVERLSDISPVFFTGLLQAIVAALFMNIYIVGLNQLSDIDIDKVNKPYLPLASGEYSVGTGIMIVTSCAVMSFCLGWVAGSWPLFWALFISFILGTAYSIDLPFMRWKRFALVAAFCILVVRAVIVQLAFFLHMQTFVLQRPAVLTRSVIFATAFMSFFSVVIALFKDIPDIDGDKIFGIQSFSVRLGQKKVFWTCIYLLEMAYSVAVMVGASSSCLWSKLITVIGHVILGSILWYRAKSSDLNKKVAITSFYMFVWKLFYAEYLLIPLVR